MRPERKVCQVQNAETLLSISRERGKRGLPLKRVYPLLYNPDLYLRAYAGVYANKGALTPGSTRETVDGMSRVKIDRLIDELRHERFRWTPVRSVHIRKRMGHCARSACLPGPISCWKRSCAPFWTRTSNHSFRCAPTGS